MTKEQVIALYKGKEHELLNKYFGNRLKEDAHERPKTIGGGTRKNSR